MELIFRNFPNLLATEHAVQTPSDCPTGRRFHRPACPGRVYLPWRGKRPSAVIELVPKNGRSVACFRTDATTGWGHKQRKKHLNLNPFHISIRRNLIWIDMSSIWQLAHVQNLANTGGRPPMNHHHPPYPDRLMDESLLFPQGVSPPPHANNMHNQPGKSLSDPWFHQLNSYIALIRSVLCRIDS